jgi:hypothetical protein
MSRLVRLLLICIIAAAIPLKGLAAVTMLGCGPGHSRQAAASMQAHHSGSASLKSSHHGVADTSVASAALDAGEAADIADGASPESSKDSAAAVKMKCGGCSPCCAAAAPAPEQQTGPPDLQASRFTFSSAGYVGVVTDVPHRPPRTFLA